MKRLWLKCRTSYAERASIVWMWLHGMSTRAIARKSRTSVPTVCRWVKRWRLGGTVMRKYRFRETTGNKAVPAKIFRATNTRRDNPQCQTVASATTTNSYPLKNTKSNPNNHNECVNQSNEGLGIHSSYRHVNFYPGYESWLPVVTLK